MVKKYYVRIDDTEPLGDDEGLYFTIDVDENGNSTFHCVKDGEYNILVNEFNEFKNNTYNKIGTVVDEKLANTKLEAEKIVSNVPLNQDPYNADSRYSTNNELVRYQDEYYSYDKLRNILRRIEDALGLKHDDSNYSLIDYVNETANPAEKLIKLGEDIKNVLKISNVADEQIRQDISNKLTFRKVFNVGESLRVYETDLFIFAEIYQVGKTANYNKFGTNAKLTSTATDKTDWKVDDVFKNNPIPGEYCPRRSVAVMNGVMGAGETLKVTFDANGKVHYTNIGHIALTEKYDVYVSAFWIKKSAFIELDN